MRSLVVTLLAFILMLTSLAFAGQVDDQLHGSHIKFETLEKLPRPDFDINSPNSEKAKLSIDIIHQPTYSYEVIDYQQEMLFEHYYDLPKYNLLRSKNYFLII